MTDINSFKRGDIISIPMLDNNDYLVLDAVVKSYSTVYLTIFDLKRCHTFAYAIFNNDIVSILAK